MCYKPRPPPPHPRHARVVAAGAEFGVGAVSLRERESGEVERSSALSQVVGVVAAPVLSCSLLCTAILCECEILDIELAAFGGLGRVYVIMFIITI